jgi:two-component system, chemotaxis family, CheB/CheR fusion protein
MAVISATTRLTLSRTGSPAEFAESFVGRVDALARSHGLLARERWGDVALADIVKEELEPFAEDAAGRVEQGGPAVQLKPNAALALGMIVHELATNAVKHGALADPKGRLSVAWSAEDRGGSRHVVIRWTEVDGPRVEPPMDRGFGSELVERQVRHEFGGAVEADYPPQGARVTIALPEKPGLISFGHARPRDVP